ncbi:hypothetical protein HYT84_02605 [Candidatus Micrarchaeota archaeon]|nr:hypothetical protein [Candidatus Micrarchaeota archaeon]
MKVKKKTKSGSHNWIKIGLILVLIIVVVVLVYAAMEFQRTEQEKKGILVCNEAGSKCTISYHWHAILDAYICGEKLHFPLETGDVSLSPHTHKDSDKMHIHITSEVNPKTREILNKEALKIKEFFRQTKIHFNNSCINGKCNGDLCGGKTGTVKMIVNEKPNYEFENYVWKEGDKILIEFN